jgi:hypothetical protein
MSECESQGCDDLLLKLTAITLASAVPALRRTVFVRFCACGESVSVGIRSDDEYAQASRGWNDSHSGEGHSAVSRYDWLIAKLRAAA